MSKAADAGNRNKLGDKLAAWRGHRAWSIAEAARAADVSATAWAKWEGGAVEPSLRVLRKIAAAFGVTMSDLLRGIE